MTLTIFILRLGLAFLLGALIGIERQYRQKSAGLRTNTLVSVGSAAFVLLSVSLTDTGISNEFRGDPSRIAGQIVTGIGFLGAGVIMKTGMNVQGLNTAATIWCSAAVGTLAGAGMYLQSMFVSFFIILAHIGLRPLGMFMNKLPLNKDENGVYYYYIKIRCKEQVENHLRVMMLETIKSNDYLQLRSLKSTDNGTPNYTYVEAELLANKKSDASIETLAGKLTLEYGVTEVSWSVNGQDVE